MTRLHWLGAALVFLGSTAAGFALRQELRLRLRLLTAVIDSLNLLRSDIVGRLLPLPEALMDVDLVFKIAAIGILVAVLNILLSRAGRDEQALMTTIAGLVVVLVLVIQKISELFDLIKSLFSL